jgi:microcystin-dependent protein
MPRDASGNYTLPLGNPVEGGTTIDVNWANPTMEDIATQLNNVFTRDGLLGPLDKFKLIDGTQAAPALTFNSELGLGLFRESQGVLAVASEGAVSARFSSTGVDVPGVISRGGTPIALVPTGTILDFAGATAPAGYMVCDGSAVSRTTFAALFAVIGTVWGAGDGTNTFNLPDFRRRTTIGAGGTQTFGPATTVGSIGGVEGATLSVANLASHTHTHTDGAHQHATHVEAYTQGANLDHIHYGTTDTHPGHQHRHQAAGHTSVWQGYDLGYAQYGGGTPDDLGHIYVTELDGAHYHNFNTGGMSQTHAHYFVVDVASDWRNSNISIQATGSGAAHDNMQPSATVNKIIKI